MKECAEKDHTVRRVLVVRHLPRLKQHASNGAAADGDRPVESMEYDIQVGAGVETLASAVGGAVGAGAETLASAGDSAGTNRNNPALPVYEGKRAVLRYCVCP